MIGELFCAWDTNNKKKPQQYTMMKLIFAVLFAILAAVCAQNILQQGCRTSNIDTAYANFLANVKRFDNVFDDGATVGYLLSQVGLVAELTKVRFDGFMPKAIQFFCLTKDLVLFPPFYYVFKKNLVMR